VSDLLSKLKAAHDRRDMVKVEIPEYGATWFFPALTLADHEAIRKGVNPKDEHALMISGLMHMARDADGKKVFDLPPAERAAVKAELHRMELSVLQRIMVEADGGLPPSLAAEIDACDPEALRAALLEGLGEDAPALAKAVHEVDEAVLHRALSVIAMAQAGGQTTKNG
jgi:hypothetical protein